MRILCVPLAMVALSALPKNGTAGPLQGRSIPDRLAIKKMILKLDVAWSARAAAHDLSGTVGFYAKDAVLLPPNEPMATTTAAIRKSWAPLCAPSSTISWKALRCDVSRAGDMAYTYGTYTLSLKGPDGKSIRDKGKFLEIWKRKKDGRWKCSVDTFNSDLPLS